MYNAGTLNDTDKTNRGLRTSNRTALLATQLEMQGVHLAGIAESRLPQGRRTNQAYHVIAAGPDADGNCGVELWCATNLALGGKHHLCPEHMVVLHTAPRMLIVRLCSPALTATIVVAHAPTQGRRNDREGQLQWWRDAGKLLAKHAAAGGPIHLAHGWQRQTGEHHHSSHRGPRR